MIIVSDGEDGRLKPGMSANAEVIIETIPPKAADSADSVLAISDEEIAASTAPRAAPRRPPAAGGRSYRGRADATSVIVR